MNNVQIFVSKYLSHAIDAERKTGISALFVLAQAALESAWGKVAPGNMFFGVKDNDGINGNEQLLTTTEILNHADVKFPVVLSVKTILWKGKKMFEYKVKDYFRKYNSPAECFANHSEFFYKYPRYKMALIYRKDPYRFAEEIAKAGYASDPGYADKLKSIIGLIEREAMPILNQKAA